MADYFGGSGHDSAAAADGPAGDAAPTNDAAPVGVADDMDMIE
jgi:hypothetical protein